MPSVTIKFKDGTERRLEEGHRAGGSYTQKVRYEGCFVVVEDVYGGEIAFPSEAIAEVVTDAPPRGW